MRKIDESLKKKYIFQEDINEDINEIRSKGLGNKIFEVLEQLRLEQYYKINEIHEFVTYLQDLHVSLLVEKYNKLRPCQLKIRPQYYKEGKSILSYNLIKQLIPSIGGLLFSLNLSGAKKLMT